MLFIILKKINLIFYKKIIKNYINEIILLINIKY